MTTPDRDLTDETPYGSENLGVAQCAVLLHRWFTDGDHEPSQDPVVNDQGMHLSEAIARFLAEHSWLSLPDPLAGQFADPENLPRFIDVAHRARHHLTEAASWLASDRLGEDLTDEQRAAATDAPRLIAEAGLLLDRVRLVDQERQIAERTGRTYGGQQ